MPQEVSDIKQFIEMCRRKDASCTLPMLRFGARYGQRSKDKFTVFVRSDQTLVLSDTHWIWLNYETNFANEPLFTAARIKKNKKSNQVKFKVRCKRYLYTLVLKDLEKAEKLKQSLPPSTFPSWFSQVLSTDGQYNCRLSGKLWTNSTNNTCSFNYYGAWKGQ